jgi:hypothetical protein
MAVHNLARSFSTLTMQGHSYRFNYRYESWVQYASARPRPRVELAPLAIGLNELERGGGTWEFDGADAIMPALALEGAAESSIEPEEFRAMLFQALRTSSPAWDPYDS